MSVFLSYIYFMKNKVKRKKGLFDQKVNFIYDPKLDNVKPGPRVL